MEKIALIIGNESYRNFGRIRQADNDAAKLARKLEEIGFRVTLKDNLSRSRFYQSLAAFAQEAQEADVSLFYYNGHGAHHGRNSYLVPTDASLSLLLHAGRSLIDASLLADQLAVGDGQSIMILDSAWQNDVMKDLGSNRAGAALNSVKANKDQLVISAHKQKTTLPLRWSTKSRMVEELVSLLDQENLTAGQIVKLLRENVYQESNRKQTIVADNKLENRLVLNPRRSPDPNSAEAILWNTIKNSDDPNVFRAYVSQFPDGYYIEIAKQRIIDLERVVEPEPEPIRFTVRRMDAVYVTKRTSNLRDQPTTDGNRIGTLDAGTAVQVTGKVRNLPWYRVRYGNGQAFIYQTLIEPQKPADELAWLRVKDSTDPNQLQQFILRYPASKFVIPAKQRIQQLTEVVNPTPTPEPLPNRFIVTRQGNLRAAPDANSQFLGSVGVGEYVTVLSKVNGLNWYRIRSQGGITAYIWGRLIEPAPAPVVNARDKQLWDWAKSINTQRAYNRYLLEFPNGQYAKRAKRRLNRLIADEQAQQEPEAKVRTINILPVNYRNTQFPSIPATITQGLVNLANTQVSTGTGNADIVIRTDITRLEVSQTADGNAIGLSLGTALLGGNTSTRGGALKNLNLSNALQHKVKASIRLTASNRANGQSIVIDAGSKIKAPAASTDQREAVAQALRKASEDATTRLASEIAQKWGQN